MTKLKPDQHLRVTSTFSNLALPPVKGLRSLLLHSLLLTVGLRRCDARAVRDQQVHHRVAGDVYGGCRHHVAKGDGAAGGHVGGDGARRALVVAVGAHVTLELGGCLAVDATQVADQNAAGGRAAKAPRAVLPLLAMVLLGVDAEVRQRGEAWRRRRELFR